MLTGLALAGCQSGPKGLEGPNEDAPKTPESMLADQLTKGSSWLRSASESLAEILADAKAMQAKAKPDEKDGLQELIDWVDSAGDAAAEYAVAPEASADKAAWEADIAANFTKHDDARLEAITALNDALVDLGSAFGIAESLSEANSAYAELPGMIDVARGEFRSAIEDLGGKVEEETDSGDEAPVPGEASTTP